LDVGSDYANTWPGVWSIMEYKEMNLMLFMEHSIIQGSAADAGNPTITNAETEFHVYKTIWTQYSNIC
jgi:hypothetical protein